MSDKKARITRLVVGLGRTSRPDLDREEWNRAYYELEFQFSEGTTSDDFELSRKSALEAIELWLSEKAEAPAPAKPSPLSLEELDRLPWKPYPTSKTGRNAWIFANAEGAEKLHEAIRKSVKGVEIEQYVFRFSGPAEDPKMFISRNVKAEAQA
jgi:hypothetical protein